jgi:hypothetical protein
MSGVRSQETGGRSNTLIAVAIMVCLCCLLTPASDAAPLSPADQVRVENIIYQASEAKADIAAMRLDLQAARDANVAIVKERDAARAATVQAINEKDRLNNSVPMWIGWCIWIGFKWWLFAVLGTFVLRMIFVYVGGPIGSVGAQVTTNILGVLTFFATYLTNIPDNLYFRRKLAASGVEAD